MALFKIKKGLKANLPKTYNEGYCYFTTDDGKMYIDTSNASSGRVCLNAAKADQLTTARTITLSGDASGSVSFDGSKNVTLTVDIEELDNIKEAIDTKQATITGAATTITSSNLTANRALISNSSGKVAVSAVTSTELGYLDGVTSNVQTQLNGKADKSQGVLYIEGGGTTDTTNKVATWTGSHSDITKYYAGLMIAYKIGTAGSTTTTLNINNLGAVNVVRNATTAVSTSFPVNSVILLVYTVDGTTAYWKAHDYDANTRNSVGDYRKNGTKLYFVGTTTSDSSTSSSYATSYTNSNIYVDTSNVLNSDKGFKGNLVGTATSADKINTDAGSTTQPVYFSNGIPVKTTYTLGASVPSNAKFTDTTYTFATGSSNGTISVTPSGGTATNVAVKGLGSAAYTASTAYDAAGTAQTKADAALASAKTYADGIKNDLLNGAGAAYDTLKELGDLIDDNTDAIDALEIVATNKADKSHTHAASDIASGTLASARIPAATSSALGGVKVGSNISNSNGTISLTKSNVTSALGYTPPTTNTTYGVVSTTADGLAPKRDGSTTKFLRGDGTWATPPDTNTVYTHPTTTAVTGVPTGNQTPGFGGTVSVNQVSRDTLGHVSAITSRTITIPSTLANGTNTAGLIKTSSAVTSSSGYTACPVINGVPYYKDTDTNAVSSVNGKTGDVTLNGYDVKAIPTLGQHNYDADSCYDAGIFMIANGSGCPSGSQYGSLLTLPYRQASGNTTPDFGTQIFIPNGDDTTKPNSLFYRSSNRDAWNSWQEVSVAGHTHSYAGASSSGGSATSAVKLDSNAGSATQPVYFSGGKPVATTYSLGASVPSNAKFTDTTYSAATQSAAGLMSAADKKKLDGIATGANAYSLPTASSSTLGGVKTTSTVTSTSGLTACPIIKGVPYYKDTNTTYSLSSFGVTATAAELNYVDGVTSNIQTQLNGKLPITGGTITGTTGLIIDGTNVTDQVGYNYSLAVITNASKLGGIAVTNASDRTLCIFMDPAGSMGLADGVTGDGICYKYGNNYHLGPSGVYSNGSVLYGAAWNDYAEYRSQKEEIKPGYCVASADNGQVYKTTEKFQACDGIVSDTFGFAIGETEECKTPLAVAGRVLAYCEGSRYNYNAGDTVCAGPEGKVVKMTREEIREWPDRIIGIVSEIPEYETWGSGNVPVNGRIWIKIK